MRSATIGWAKWGPKDGGTVAYLTFVVVGVLVPGPTWTPLPLAGSVVTGLQAAAAAVTPNVEMATSGCFLRASRAA